MEALQRLPALYSYEAQEENELGFAEGERLELLVRMEDDWWLMRKDGRTYGLAPSNYFEAVAEAAELETNIFEYPTWLHS